MQIDVANKNLTRFFLLICHKMFPGKLFLRKNMSNICDALRYRQQENLGEAQHYVLRVHNWQIEKEYSSHATAMKLG